MAPTDKPQTLCCAPDPLHDVVATAALRLPIQRGMDDREWLIIPDGFRHHDITDPHRLPPRAAASVEVDDRASLENYAKRHLNPDTSAIFADFDKGTITARLDWHPHNQTGQAGQHGALKHACRLTLRQSEEFKRWNDFEGDMHAQADFALFLEENAADITDPNPADMIEISRDLEAVAGQKFKSRNRTDNGDLAFFFETESQIVSKVQAPPAFALSIPIYQGEAPETLVARFRWKATATGLLLGYKWHRVEYMRQARFAQIAHDAAEATGLPAYLGRTG
jgi:uncharacterized protein YfdQ (DUF2303 family)